MPLIDLTRFKDRLEWSSFHSNWGVKIVDRLNEIVLSDRFVSHTNIHLGTRIEVDVGTLERVEDGSLFASANGVDAGGVAVAAVTYAPPAPVLSAEFAFTAPEVFEVKVYRGSGGWELAAAIELVSKSNKDRPDSRREFAIKCASYLYSGVSVVVIDVVTERLAELHSELCDLIDLPESVRWRSPSGLSAVSYRVVQGALKKGLTFGNGQVRLDVWPHALSVGAELPTVPLWLAADLAVPLELELTYAAACKSLRLG